MVSIKKDSFIARNYTFEKCIEIIHIIHYL